MDDASFLEGGLGGGGSSGSPSADELLSTGKNEGSEQEWPYDPSEPRYCVCNQVSYGDMVACDNDDVSLALSHACERKGSQRNLFFTLVSLRMVPLPVCGYHSTSKGQMVLSHVPGEKKRKEMRKITGRRRQLTSKTSFGKHLIHPNR